MKDSECVELIEKIYSSMSLNMDLDERRSHASSIILSAKMKGIDFDAWNKKSDLFSDSGI